jgi:hypothetical protein
MDQHWALSDVRLSFDEVGHLFISGVKSYLMMIRKGQICDVRLAVHLNDLLDRFQLTDGHYVGAMTDNVSSNCSMTRERQSTLEYSGIKWPTLRNHILCMAHIIQLVLWAFMSFLGVKGCTKYWKAHEHNQYLERMKV